MPPVSWVSPWPCKDLYKSTYTGCLDEIFGYSLSFTNSDDALRIDVTIILPNSTIAYT